MDLRRGSPLVLALLFRERALLKFVLNRLGNLSVYLCESIVDEAEEVLGDIL